MAMVQNTNTTKLATILITIYIISQYYTAGFTNSNTQTTAFIKRQLTTVIENSKAKFREQLRILERPCRLHPFRFNLTSHRKFGLVHPLFVDGNVCDGTCDLISSSSIMSTHAKIMAMTKMRDPNATVQTPCCVSIASGLPVPFTFDFKGKNTTYQKFDFVVTECGCR